MLCNCRIDVADQFMFQLGGMLDFEKRRDDETYRMFEIAQEVKGFPVRVSNIHFLRIQLPLSFLRITLPKIGRQTSFLLRRGVSLAIMKRKSSTVGNKSVS